MAEIKREADWQVIPIEEAYQVDMARRAAKKWARFLGFGEVNTALIAISVSELSRNILSHAGRGKVTLRTVSWEGNRGLEIVFADQGPGIEDVDRVLRGGYSAKGSLGIGLSGARRMMDELEIESGRGKGTTIWIRKWL